MFGKGSHEATQAQVLIWSEMNKVCAMVDSLQKGGSDAQKGKTMTVTGTGQKYTIHATAFQWTCPKVTWGGVKISTGVQGAPAECEVFNESTFQLLKSMHTW